ncbi:MAG: tRNA epoxyqueuosine(34) reductase QueG [Ignavibacteriaceae bacterium]|nr:tRNA epoxyqueuosine(34) reductase QueG [Ignavibacteriaceae bacterium]MCW8814305.1 tRNA epoxyqueuosine(34) reductase QueG [Chlorobium sp.]MCW8817532.1 tRNA epoxyqueuosine(34) reductase QueG [Ignavibacteriaceae bacterium]MCW8960775.1 tRNA epoxyqueuosine(34) reductase QueG [Ignavibacteriaceae bacterium]
MATKILSNEIVIQKAKQFGFDLVGFAKAEILGKESKNMKNWLQKNYQAGMDYMERNFEKRKDVKKILPGAKSIISLGLNYYTSDNYSNDKNKGKTCLPVGKVSCYAWGKDYHLIIWVMLDELEEELKKIDPQFESISYVDTGPVMDKAWAVRAGLGWLGKHTNVINREIGSWFFIANIITNYDFNYSEQFPDFCGTCTACIDACPTDAIIQEYVVDANKCISYLTIENKSEIPDEFKNKFDNWLFGCDICQDVCPWNQKFPIETLIKDFHPQNKELILDEVLELTEEDFKERFKTSPIKRAKLSGLKRNSLYLKNI